MRGLGERPHFPCLSSSITAGDAGVAKTERSGDGIAHARLWAPNNRSTINHAGAHTLASVGLAAGAVGAFPPVPSSVGGAG